MCVWRAVSRLVCKPQTIARFLDGWGIDESTSVQAGTVRSPCLRGVRRRLAGLRTGRYDNHYQWTCRDTSGGVLPGATVTAKHVVPASSARRSANSEGPSRLPSLPPGTYEVTVALEGFKTTVVKDVVYRRAGRRHQLTLEVGGVSEPVPSPRRRRSSRRSRRRSSSTINTNQITKLPLTSRSAMDFVNFLPGVSTPGGNRDATINGLPAGRDQHHARRHQHSGQHQPLDRRLLRHRQPPPRRDRRSLGDDRRPGRRCRPGRGADQVRHPSGGNNYTGSGYHYYRNDKLNANTWFNNRAGMTKAELLQNQFGARFGGPLVIPGCSSAARRSSSAIMKSCSQPSDTHAHAQPAEARRPGRQLRYGGASSTCCSSAQQCRDCRDLVGRPDDRCAADRHPHGARHDGVIESVDANIDELRYNVAGGVEAAFPDRRASTTTSPTTTVHERGELQLVHRCPDTLNGFDAAVAGIPGLRRADLDAPAAGATRCVRRSAATSSTRRGSATAARRSSSSTR